MPITFRSRLINQDTLIGTLVTLPTTEGAEILAGAGFDWLLIDLEHSAMGIDHAQRILQAVGEQAACIVRVPLNDEIWIKKVLDTGCHGMMVPQVNTAEDARRAVRLSKYPPQGSRSVGLARAQRYGPGLEEAVTRANDTTAVILQAEHLEAVANIHSILDVPGVDAVLVGPYDLSASLGLTGQVEHPDVQAAIAQVRTACQARSVPVGIFTATASRAQAALSQGFSFILVSGDMLMLDQAARGLLTALKPQPHSPAQK